MGRHEAFEWDLGKDATNHSKHGVKFEQAAEVLSDVFSEVYHVEAYDDAHSEEEDRWITTGSHPLRRTIVMRISWTERKAKDEVATRIISARLATKVERATYEKIIKRRLGS